ncbi:amidohydrolase family protein [Thalassotalea litorea]|uniref:Amidohydrolase family protein n=1 Tax=Thalassotalea litorea TaxID=2020715 RepID=A0A5R9INJ2_9GAMM|nr:amidohydrolase family protein [Thalassotalea litorea]TLU64831.1 amidohydrolase family protein [Thalassotalea litorea]
MKTFRKFLLPLSLACTFSAFAVDNEQELPTQTLFRNVNIFNGVDNKLYQNHYVLVEKNIIKQVSATEIQGHKNVVVIDGAGRTLMPGLIDAHVHLNLQNLDNPAAIDGVSNMTWEEIGALAYDAAQEYLYSGFTTVRDLCGMHDGMRKHIEAGTLIGPRIYLAGACISQTSGHGDWRTNAQALGDDGNKNGQVQKLGISTLADGADEVLKACRNSLAGGADFCKMMAGGGVTSMRDPIHSIQGTMDELRAMTTATKQWDTIGAVHAYHDDSVNRALDAGVMSIEHGNLMTEKSTFKNVKKKGAYLVPAMAGFSNQLLKHPQYGNPDLPLKAKVEQIIKNYENWIALANATDINIGYGTDVVVSSKLASRGIRDFQMGQFVEGFGNYKTLVYMTSNNGKLMALTGKNNPYPSKLGVIEEGAYADIILVDGNPLKDLSVLGASFDMWATPREERTIKTIPFVMKDGKIVYNKL